MKKIFCLSLYFKSQKFIFSQSEWRVLTMSSWSRRVKIRGLKSSIEVQLPTVSGNLRKMLSFCLCTSFVSCYCVLTEKIDGTDSVWPSITFPVSESDHFSSPTETRMCSLADCCKPLCSTGILVRRPTLATCRTIISHFGVCTSQTVCWSTLDVLTFCGSIHPSTSQQRQITASHIRFWWLCNKKCQITRFVDLYTHRHRSSDKSQQAILEFNDYATKTVKLHVA